MCFSLRGLGPGGSLAAPTALQTRTAALVSLPHTGLCVPEDTYHILNIIYKLGHDTLTGHEIKVMGHNQHCLRGTE